MNQARPPLRLIREGFPDRPAFGTAVSEAILLRVAAGDLEPTLRLHRPGPELAFSKQDVLSPGFERAAEAAREAGFEPVIRLAGGRAAVFHEGTFAFARSASDPRPPRGTRERFEEMAELVATALRRLGVRARVGEISGEYCPGAWSVNARGKVKLAGIGQRLIAGGAHIGGVVVVGGSARIRDVLVPVYEALELEWDPATVGSVEDEISGISLAEVETALLEELGRRYELLEASLDPETLALAEGLEAGHRPGG
jgi:octanoyl-[GcvH]:protein N-octanoyltransferase